MNYRSAALQSRPHVGRYVFSGLQRRLHAPADIGFSLQNGLYRCVQGPCCTTKGDLVPPLVRCWHCKEKEEATKKAGDKIPPAFNIYYSLCVASSAIRKARAAATLADFSPVPLSPPQWPFQADYRFPSPVFRDLREPGCRDLRHGLL